MISKFDETSRANSELNSAFALKVSSKFRRHLKKKTWLLLRISYAENFTCCKLCRGASYVTIYVCRLDYPVYLCKRTPLFASWIHVQQYWLSEYMCFILQYGHVAGYLYERMKTVCIWTRYTETRFIASPLLCPAHRMVRGI